MRVQTFQVVPALPDKLKGLWGLAHNLLWTWDEGLRQVFTRLDHDLWDTTYQNPVLMLGQISQERLQAAADDTGFMAYYERMLAHFRDYLQEETWWDGRYQERPIVAYFSAEFGLAECLPIYSGGLGVLAGHHIKAASDLGVPLVGVGLLYQEGYFRQYLTSDGWQQESYPTNDFYNLPVLPVKGDDGEPLRIEISMAGRPMRIAVWKAQVGRIPLYLLDTNLPENPRDLQDITDQLYGGDTENRIRQEIVLGVGGLRALCAMGIPPVVCHMNEGHSAFQSLERIRMLIRDHNLTFAEALEASRAGSVFTTHTPVPAGFDLFSPELIDRYFGDYMREVGISREGLLSLGRADAGDSHGMFNMAALALRTSAYANGVSKLHGQVSRALLRRFMPDVPEDEIPISHVTNGAHTRSCVSREMAGLFDRYLGPNWWRHPGLVSTWEGVDRIPDEELWSTHERRRERLVAFARRRVMRQLRQRGASTRDVERARGILDTRTLTIGFARRFATYKRANLLLADLERLKRIILDEKRPVQVIFAGKAHPKDGGGKEMLKAVFSFCEREEVRRHAVFLEDYDLAVARYLVQGVDVWLNTPRRGLEASGTSGMKVLPNGGINLSVPDGWWWEAQQPDVGWSIGKGESYEDAGYQDTVESNALYDLLEKDIVPLFYEREADGLPRAWIAKMKRSLKQLTPTYSTNRMVWEYSDRFYLPAARRYADLSVDGLRRARALADWKRFVWGHWSEVRVEGVAARNAETHHVGEGFTVGANVHLGSVEPGHVVVEVYYGPQDPQGNIVEGRTIPMTLSASEGPGQYVYEGVVPCDRSGMLGYSVRIRPSHPDDDSILGTGLLTWW